MYLQHLLQVARPNVSILRWAHVPIGKPIKSLPAHGSHKENDFGAFSVTPIPNPNSAPPIAGSHPLPRTPEKRNIGGRNTGSFGATPSLLFRSCEIYHKGDRGLFTRLENVTCSSGKLLPGHSSCCRNLTSTPLGKTTPGDLFYYRPSHPSLEEKDGHQSNAHRHQKQEEKHNSRAKQSTDEQAQRTGWPTQQTGRARQALARARGASLRATQSVAARIEREREEGSSSAACRHHVPGQATRVDRFL
jgi:hypothetical protein